LVLVKGDRQMKSQVNRAANVISVWKKMRKTLPLRNSQKKKKGSNPAIKKNNFRFWLKEIAR
jgi:hypothetical protein